MIMGKGQAALDFLMTYGWALLLIVLVVGALFALGIFDTGTFLGSRAAGFTQMGVSGWQLNAAGNFSMKFKNKAGTDVNITLVNATLNNLNAEYNESVAIANGKESAIIPIGTFSTVPASGGSYSVRVSVLYTDTATGFNYTDTGTLTGKVN